MVVVHSMGRIRSALVRPMLILVRGLLQLMMLRLGVRLHRLCNVKAAAKDSRHHNKVEDPEHAGSLPGAGPVTIALQTTGNGEAIPVSGGTAAENMPRDKGVSVIAGGIPEVREFGPSASERRNEVSSRVHEKRPPAQRQKEIQVSAR